MTFVLPENVQETSTTTGTGQLTLDGPVTGALDFDSQLASGDKTFYTISDGTDLEVGEGTFTNTSGDQLTRDTILYSTNGGAAVSWTAGTRNVFSGLPGTVVASMLDPAGGNGMLAKTAANTYARRTLTAGVGMSIADGDGVAGNPTIAVVSVADYGALGVAADDGPAIQLAIDAANAAGGGDVFVPMPASGVYSIQTTLDMTGMNGVMIRGVGNSFRSPIIQWNGAAGATMLLMNSTRYCGLSKLNFDCNSIANIAIRYYWDGVHIGGGSFECVFSKLFIQKALDIGMYIGDPNNFQCSENEFDNIFFTQCVIAFKLRGQNSHNQNLDKVNMFDNGTGLDIEGGYVNARNLTWANNSVRDIKLNFGSAPHIFIGGYSEGSEQFLFVVTTGTNFQATFIGVQAEASSSGNPTLFVQDGSLANITWVNCEFHRGANVIVSGSSPIPANSLLGYKRFITCRWTDITGAISLTPSITTNGPFAHSICVDLDTRHAGAKPFNVDSNPLPSIFGSRIWKTANSLPTTITNMIHGSFGQEVLIMFGDNNTTINFSSGNMLGNGGVDWAAKSGDHMLCVLDDDANWRCIVSADTASSPALPNEVAISVGASPFTYTNSGSKTELVEVIADQNVTNIQYIRNGTARTISTTWGAWDVSPGDSIKVTYPDPTGPSMFAIERAR